MIATNNIKVKLIIIYLNFILINNRLADQLSESLQICHCKYLASRLKH